MLFSGAPAYRHNIRADRVQSNDYNLALVGLLFVTLLTLFSNFAADRGVPLA
jgi:ABC-type dipeptide/oligopeptide/nickel transport system permease component